MSYFGRDPDELDYLTLVLVVATVLTVCWLLLTHPT